MTGGDTNIHAVIGVTGAQKACSESISVWQLGPEVVVLGHVARMRARFGTQSWLEANWRQGILTSERVDFTKYSKGFATKSQAGIAEYTRGYHHPCQQFCDRQHQSVLFDKNLGHRAARDR